MDVFRSSIVGDVTIDSLQSLTIPALAALYQEVTGRLVERFNEKESGVRRCREALEEIFSDARNGEEMSEPLGLTKPIHYPFRGRVSGFKSRSYAALILLLTEGATITKVLREVGGTRRRLRDLLYRMNRDVGYGVQEECGRLYLLDGQKHIRAVPAPVVVESPCRIEDVPSSSRSPADAQVPIPVDAVDRAADPGLCGCPVVPRRMAASVLVGCSIEGTDDAGCGEEYGDVAGDLGGDRLGDLEPGPGGVHRGPGDAEPSEAQASVDGAGEGASEQDILHALLDRVNDGPRVPVRITVTARFLDRIRFVMRHVRAVDVEEILVRAFEYFDRAVCATKIEKSKITMKHRDGSLEDFAP
jgi:hypothetical protein